MKIMLDNTQLEQYLQAISGVDYVKVSGDGYHYQVIIVSNIFTGKSKVHRQQWVYKQVQHYITGGQLHALTMQTWTKDEWEKISG